jgi:hypothetical protein
MLRLGWTHMNTQRIKAASDIVRVIGAHVELRRTGSRYSGLCPFHSEKTASFKVYRERQRFHCFGCDADGDVVDFISRIRGLDFGESMRWLASEAGITLNDSPILPEDRRRWAAERAEIARDLPAARLWRRTALELGKDLLAELKAALFDPLSPPPQCGEIADWERRIAAWRRLDGAHLVKEFCEQRCRDPTSVAAMVRVGQDRESAEVRAVIAYCQQLERNCP